MDTREKRPDSRKRTATEAARGGTAVRRRRSANRRKHPATAPYNPGQVRLLEDLVTEFARTRAVAHLPGGPDLAFRVTDDIPHLGAFIDYKIRDLVCQQRRLAALWKLNPAV